MIRALLLAALLGGCTVPLPVPGTEMCRAERTIGYVGQRYTDRVGRTMKRKARAGQVRVIEPGATVTQEFRANRLNAVLDERRLVTRTYCG